MQPLKPLRPAGNSRRKALGRASEIQRLRAEGYTIAAIHEALEAEGVKVGWSTVQREAARFERPDAPRLVRVPSAPPHEAAAKSKLGDTPLPTPETPPVFPNKDERSPRKIASDFMRTVNSNPLLQPKKET